MIDESTFPPTQRQVMQIAQYQSIAETFGQFDQSAGANGSHYAPADQNPFKEQGLICSNCYFFEGGRACEIVSGEIDPNAVCKLWVIPENLVMASQSEGNQMKVKLPIQITAADSESRTITGRIITFEEAGNASTGKVVFQSGSIQPKDVILNLEHDRTRRIGKAITTQLSADGKGIDATYKIANTTAGNDALVEAQDGLRDGLSVEVAVSDFKQMRDGTMRVLAGELTGVALVSEPAIRSARVSQVAATEEENSETNPVEDKTTTEGDEVENTVTDATTEATVEAAQVVTASANLTGSATTRPRLDFSPVEYLRNTVKAALGDDDARAYVRAAADTTDNAGLVPTRQLSTVINGLANATRSNIDAISRGTLPDAGMSFEIPKITVLPTVAATSEAGTPSNTDQNAAFVTVNVAKYAGQQTFSVELMDRTSPAFMTELLNNLAAQYAKVTDTAVNAALISGATADATTTTTYPTAAELLGFVSRGAASVLAGTQGFARNIIANTSQWANIMTLNDSGRPIYNAAQPQNAGGSVSPTSLRGNVAGLDLYVTANTASTTDTDGSLLIVNPDAYTWYESPTYTLRADVIASGEISLMFYGYGAIATKLAAGAFKNNKA